MIIGENREGFGATTKRIFLSFKFFFGWIYLGGQLDMSTVSELGRSHLYCSGTKLSSIFYHLWTTFATLTSFVRNMTLFVFFSCLLLSCLPKTGYESTIIGSSSKINTIFSPAGQTKIARDSDGYWFVVVDDDAGTTDYFIKIIYSTTTANPTSSDDWVTTVLVAASGSPVVETVEGTIGAIIIDSNDTLHFVYIEEALGDIRYSYCDNLSEINCTDSWSDPVTLNVDLDNVAIHPTIAVDSDNTPHVIWYQVISRVRNIFYTKANATGGFYADKQMGTATVNKMFPRIAIDTDDTVHIAWQDADESAFCYLKSKDAANTAPALSTWKNSTYDNTTPDNVFTTDANDGRNIRGCSLVIDVYNNVWLGGTIAAGDDINVYRCPAGDNAWDSVSLAINSTYNYQVQLGAAGKGELHMVGINSTSNDVIYRKYTTSGGWDGDDTTIKEGIFEWPCIEKRIRPDSSSCIGLVWGDDTNDDVYWSTVEATPINLMPGAPKALTQREKD